MNEKKFVSSIYICVMSYVYFLLVLQETWLQDLLALVNLAWTIVYGFFIDGLLAFGFSQPSRM